MDINELPNYVMTTEEEDQNIYETSFVENPATGFSFLKFNKDEVKTLEFKQITTGYQRMVSGVWFMPDTKYLRYDKNNGMYTAEFKREDLKEALLKYLKSDYANLIKVEHQGEYLEGFMSIEHWIYEDENTVSPIFGLTISDLGYSADMIKPGTVFKTVYVESEMFWNEQILSGKVKGFSIGGLFSLEEENKALKQYFAEAAEQVVEVVSIVEEVKSDDVIVDADASPQKSVNEDVDDSPINEDVQPTIAEPTNSEIMSKFVELQSKLENYISENSLLKVNVENKEKELALLQIENSELIAQKAKQEEVIAKQTTHLKDSPIKPISPAKSVAPVIANTDTKLRTKNIGGFDIQY